MLPHAFLTMHNARIQWIVKYPDGREFKGSDILNHVGGHYDVLISNTVNHLQSLHGMLEFEFRRN